MVLCNASETILMMPVIPLLVILLLAAATLAGRGQSPTGTPVLFVSQGTSISVWKGTNNPPGESESWRAVDYDESGWSPLVQPLWMGNLFGASKLTDMRTKYSTVFLRKKFVVSNPASLDGLSLSVGYDDGFVAWINGVEVGRANVKAGEIGASDIATQSITDFIGFYDSGELNVSDYLRPGTNVLAVVALNASLNDSDFYISADLTGFRDTTAPGILRVFPETNSVVPRLTSIEVLLDEPVRGVDAEDLLANNIPATNVTQVSASDYVFDFPDLEPGPVSIRFRADHGITDLSAGANKGKFNAWKLVIDPRAPTSAVQISEFLASNKHSVRDEEGSREDWIELRNTTSEPVALGGWTLTDDPQIPAKWKLPAFSLARGGTLLIFASGKDRTNATGILHTNFRLDSGGGYLGLYTPEGNAASVYDPYPPQTADVAYGRVPGNEGVTGYFPTPTPGQRNSVSGAGFGPEVEFSEVSRTYLGTLTLALATTNPAARIRYTLDHSEPTSTSKLYNGPVAITNAVEVRTRAFVTGLLPGPLRSESYLPISAGLAAFRSDLPVMVIHGFNGPQPGLSAPSSVHVEVFDRGADGFSSPAAAPSLASRATIAVRGSSTAGYPKLSFKMEFQDEYGADLHRPLLGMPQDSDWVLYAPNNFEPILIHNPFAHQLSRDIGRYSPRTRFVEVFYVPTGTGAVTTNTYFGIYVVEEQIKIGAHRVPVETVSPLALQPPEVTGGYLFKIDRGGPNETGIGTPHQFFLVVDPMSGELTPAQYMYLQGYFNAFDAGLYGPNAKDPVQGYRAFADVPSWIDHHLLNVLTFNVDALRLSAYFFKPRNGRIQFGPLWDFDRSLRSTDGRDLNPRTWRATDQDQGTDFFNYPWWDRMFRDLEFYQQYIDRYEELRLTHFGNTNMFRLVDELAGQVRQAQPREFRRWKVSSRGGYEGEVRDLKKWLTNRLDFIDGQFVRPPAMTFLLSGVSRGVEVSFDMRTNATIYYTLDGTDPRAVGGGVQPAALEYHGPFVISENALMMARAYNPDHRARTGANNPPLKSHWSGPVRHTLAVRPSPLIVTEVMFHPEDPGAGVDPSDLEFVELLNRGPAPVSLKGVAISGGIQFQFPVDANWILEPDERVMIVRNREIFAQFHPGVTNIAGDFTGSLGNAGDRVRVSGRLGEVIADFSYLDSWAQGSDGSGYSLVPTYEGLDASRLGESTSWRRSAFVGGSPSEGDAVSVPDMRLGLEPVGESVQMTLRVARSRGYTVWARDSLDMGDWQFLRTIPLRVSDRIEAIRLPVDTAGRWYRITSP